MYKSKPFRLSELQKAITTLRSKGVKEVTLELLFDDVGTIQFVSTLPTGPTAFIYNVSACEEKDNQEKAEPTYIVLS